MYTANSKRQIQVENLSKQNEQIKAVQNILMDRKLQGTTKKCVEIVNSKLQLS